MRLALPARGGRRCVPVQLVEVEGVQGVPGLEQHVVGDVDQVRDGAHAAVAEAQAHLDGARRHGKAGDEARRVARAALGIARSRRPWSARRRPREPCRQRAGASVVPKCAASSRAMPRCESASGRLGVTFTSNTSSTAPMNAATSSPAGAVGGRIKIPSPSSPRPISGSLHSMPGDITPRTSRASRVLPTRQIGAGRRPAHAVAGGWHVGGAAHDLLFAAARAHAHDAQLVGLGVRPDAEHLGHHHARRARGPWPRCLRPPALARSARPRRARRRRPREARRARAASSRRSS